MPSSLLGAHPAAASGGETPDETKPDKVGWDKPGDEALSFKDRTTLRSTMVASFEAAIKGKRRIQNSNSTDARSRGGLGA